MIPWQNAVGLALAYWFTIITLSAPPISTIMQLIGMMGLAFIGGIFLFLGLTRWRNSPSPLSPAPPQEGTGEKPGD